MHILILYIMIINLIKTITNQTLNLIHSVFPAVKRFGSLMHRYVYGSTQFPSGTLFVYVAEGRVNRNYV